MAFRIVLLLAAALCSSCGVFRPSAEDLRNDPHGALVWAARTGDVAAIRRLAASGVDLDDSSATAIKIVFPDFDHIRWTALQHAVGKHQTEAVRVLLEWGAQPDVAEDGAPPLVIAAGSEDPTIARLLLDVGADIDQADADRRTPLMQAVEGDALWGTLFGGGCKTEIVRTLVNAGARPAPNSDWNHAIWWAGKHNCKEVLQLIQSPKDALEQKPATPAPFRP